MFDFRKPKGMSVREYNFRISGAMKLQFISGLLFGCGLGILLAEVF